jgi:hypothetical protein
VSTADDLVEVFLRMAPGGRSADDLHLSLGAARAARHARCSSGAIAPCWRRSAERREALAGPVWSRPREHGGPSVGVALVVPACLLLARSPLLILAAAGPVATLTQVHREGTVILAFDTSNSMRATDLAPSRLAAAKKAAA